MSEERFKSVIDEETMSIMPYLVSDNEEECFYNLEGCVDLLNTLSNEIEEVGISIKLFEDDVQIKDKKIEEQQSIIKAKDSLLSALSKENEQLRGRVKEFEKLISDIEKSEGMSIENLIEEDMI